METTLVNSIGLRLIVFLKMKPSSNSDTSVSLCQFPNWTKMAKKKILAPKIPAPWWIGIHFEALLCSSTLQSPSPPSFRPFFFILFIPSSSSSSTFLHLQTQRHSIALRLGNPADRSSRLPAHILRTSYILVTIFISGSKSETLQASVNRPSTATILPVSGHLVFRLTASARHTRHLLSALLFLPHIAYCSFTTPKMTKACLPGTETISSSTSPAHPSSSSDISNTINTTTTITTSPTKETTATRPLRPRSTSTSKTTKAAKATNKKSETMDRKSAALEISLPITYTPTTHRISKAKKGKRVHACEYPGCAKVFTRAEHRRYASDITNGQQSIVY